MDVFGQDMTWVPDKGKAPQRVRVKRSIGQEKKNEWSKATGLKMMNAKIF